METNELARLAIEATKERLKKRKVNPTIEQTLIHVMEEIGELAYQVNNKLLNRNTPVHKNFGEEIADCIILLMMLADQYNLDVEKELLSKIEDLKSRT